MSGVLLAAACAAAATALTAPRGEVGLPASPRTGRHRSRAVLAVAAVAGMAAPVAAVSPRIALLGLLAGALVLAGHRSVRRGRQARRAAATGARVVELCEALQAELAAGQTADGALARAAAEWPFVGPVARAAASGADVVGALRDLAAEPGAGALRLVAAAWQVSHRTGHGLADALGRVAEDLRAAEQTRRVVAGELASARATARLLAGLPVVALAMGAGAGAAPWAFLLGHPVGLACLSGGLGLGYAGLSWVDALARDVDEAS